MFGIKTITRREHTTEVTFEDGTIANQFVTSMLTRERDGELYVVAQGVHTSFEEWLKTVQACVANSLSLAEGVVDYADGTCLHTPRGGVALGFIYEPRLEEHLAASAAEWDRRRAGLFARAAQGKFIREAEKSLDALEDA